MEILRVHIELDLTVKEDDLAQHAERAFNIANDAYNKFFDLGKPEIRVTVQQGSLHEWIDIIVPIQLVVNTLGGFDGMMGGLERISTLCKQAVGYIEDETKKSNPEAVVSVKRSKAFPEKFNDVIKQVRNGRLSPAEAENKLRKLINKEDVHGDNKIEVFQLFRNFIDLNYNESLEMRTNRLEDIKYHQIGDPVLRRLPSSVSKRVAKHGVEIWYDPETGQRKTRKFTT